MLGLCVYPFVILPLEVKRKWFPFPFSPQANCDGKFPLCLEALEGGASGVPKSRFCFACISQTVYTALATADRLADLLNNPKLAAYFQTLDVDVHEGKRLSNSQGGKTNSVFQPALLRIYGPGDSALMGQPADESEVTSSFWSESFDSQFSGSPDANGEHWPAAAPDREYC